MYIPEEIDLAEVLMRSGFSELTRESGLFACCYFIDILYKKKHMTRSEWSEFHPLSKKFLELVIGSRSLSKVKTALLKIGIIEVKKNKKGRETYKKGKVSKQYRIGKGFWESKFREVKFREGFQKRLRCLSERISLDVIGESKIKALIYKSLKKMDIDSKGISSYLLNRGLFSGQGEGYYRYIAEAAQRREFYFNADKNGRLYHFVTNIPKDCRQFISFEGEELMKLDISASHPCLMASYYPAELPERALFVDAVKSGNFYKLLNDGLPAPFNYENEEEKALLKEAVFREVLYSCNYVKTTMLNHVFSERFPLLSGILKEKKKWRHADLPNELMQLEADIMYKNAGSRIAEALEGEEAFILSIHDCFVVAKKHVEFVKQVLEEEFEKIVGFKPNIKVSVF